MPNPGRTRTDNITLLVAGLALAAGSVVAGWQEFLVFYRPGDTQVTRAAELTSTTTLGLSISSATATVGDCVGAMSRIQSLEMRYQPEEVRTGLVEHCQALADRAVETSPTLSYAWYAGALAASIREDYAGMNFRLVRSQLTSPSEQWLAENRVNLAEEHFEHLDTQSLTSHQSDLALLVQSGIGLRSIARRYIAQADFRSRISDVVEQMPPAVQERFIGALNRAIRNAGY